jgi:hypothetical protein
MRTMKAVKCVVKSRPGPRRDSDVSQTGNEKETAMDEKYPANDRMSLIQRTNARKRGCKCVIIDEFSAE